MMKVLHGFAKNIAYFALIILMLVAITSTVGRIMLPKLVDRDKIIAALHQQFNVPVTIGAIEGSWSGLSPNIKIQTIQLMSPELSEQAAFQVGHVFLKLNLFSSLFNRTLIFDDFVMDGLHIVLVEDENKIWSIPGLQTTRQNDSSNAVEHILAQHQIYLNNASIIIKPFEKPEQRIEKFDGFLKKNKTTDHYYLSGRVSFDDAKKPLIFSAQVLGSPFDLTNCDIDFYVNISELQLDTALVELSSFQERLGIEALTIGASQIWGKWSGNQLSSLKGYLKIPEFQWIATKKLPAVSDFSVQFSWDMDELIGAKLMINDLQFMQRIADQSEKFAVRKLQLSIKNLHSNPSYLLAIDALNLAMLKKLLLSSELLPEKSTSVLQTFDPKGMLKNIHVSYVTEDDGSTPRYSVIANLENIGMSAWKNTPAGKGINGFIQVINNQGFIELDTDDLTLHFPKIFPTAWQYQLANGRVAWTVDNDMVNVKSNVLKLAGDVGDIYGKFSLAIDRHGDDDNLTLEIGLQNVDAKNTPDYLPKKINPKLKSWLTSAIKKGKIQQGGFIYHGLIHKNAKKHQKTIAMFFDINDATFAYQPLWPEIHHADALVDINLPQVSVNVSQATILKSTLTDTQVTLEKNNNLLVVSNAVGPMDDVITLLKESPLKKHAGNVVAKWKIDGDVASKIRIDLPLKSKDLPVVDVNAKIQNSNLILPEIPLKISKISGDFNYHSRLGINAKLDAEIFNQVASIDILNSNQQAVYDSQVIVKSRFSSENLSQWVGPNYLSLISGESAYKVAIGFPVIPGSKRLKSDVVFTSNFRGVKLELPDGLGKTAKQEKPIKISISLKDKPKNLSVSYNKYLHALFELNENSFSRASVKFGGEVKEFEQKNGIVVLGYLPTFDAQSWEKLFAKLQTDSGRTNNDVKKIQVKIDELKFHEQVFHDVDIHATQETNYWHINTNTPMLSGKIKWFKNNIEAHEVDLDYLFLTTSEDKFADPLMHVDPMTFPSINFSTKNLFLNDDDLGQCAFKVRSTKGGDKPGLFIEDIQAQAKHLSIESAIYWTKKGEQHQSSMTSYFQSDNVSDVLADWGLQPTVSSKHATVDAKLSWPGSPINFDLTQAAGMIEMQLSDGQFNEVDSAAASLLRVFGVLNNNTLLRRLRLDFSDLTDKGLSYDSISGVVDINDGMLTIRDILKIEGPSATIYLSGETNLVTQELNQEMLVILPLTGNFPLAATLVGAPQVGGALFLTEKILQKTPFKDVLNKITSVRYSVTGNWQEPSIEALSVINAKEKESIVDESKRNLPEE